MEIKSLGSGRRIKLHEIDVIRRRDVTDDLMLLWVEKPEGFSFKAGQYCTVGLDDIERAYSISSAPHEEELELFLELVPPPDGILTPKLWSVGPGAKLTIRPRAKGLFVFKPNLRNQLLVSTVTGIVPYVSIIRDYLHNDREGHHFYVLQGASYQDEFTYDRELNRLAVLHPELLTYVPTVSRPNEKHNSAWTGEIGRVNDIVEKYVERFGLKHSETQVYACGHPEMIEDVKKRLSPKGFQIEEERFWKQS